MPKEPRRPVRAEPVARWAQIRGRLDVTPKPVSVRNVFYQMVSFHGLEKSERAYKMIDNDLRDMRLLGDIRYSWIADASRPVLGETSSVNVVGKDAVESCLDDVCPVTSVWEQQEQDIRPHIFVESHSTAAMIRPVCSKYEVSVWAGKGYSSLSYAYRSMLDEPTHIGILTDYDDYGGHIENAFFWHLDYLGCCPLKDKIALTERQVEVLGLPKSPAPAGSVIEYKTELEAIPVPVLRQLVEDWIVGLLPEGQDTWAEYEGYKQEQADRVDVLKGRILGSDVWVRLDDDDFFDDDGSVKGL